MEVETVDARRAYMASGDVAEAITVSGESSLRARAWNALKGLGYSPEDGSDGDISYWSEGVHLYARTSDKDQTFVTIMAACEADGSRISNLETANRMANRWKAVKVMVEDHGVYVADEMFVSPNGDISHVIGRATGVVTSAARSYLKGEA